MKVKQLITRGVFFLTFIFVSQALIAQGVVLKGRVTSGSDSSPITDATVVIKELNKQVLVDTKGRYELTLKPAKWYTVIVSCMGYNTKEQRVKLADQQIVELNVSLEPQANLLDEALVSATKSNANITRAEMGVERLQMEQIKVIPALMGEVDLIKSLQLLPGVQSASEGSSGFNVRGGSYDQNLILLDKAPMYNVSHLMGFFSIFNNDAIDGLELYKGDIPAVHGGRLSSVLEVNSKDGNFDKFKFNGGIGTISSRLTLETPIVKDKLSILVSGRRTYADLFLKLKSDMKNNKLNFYDVNAKVVYKANDNNRIYFTGYLGSDIFGMSNIAEMNFGNQVGVLRWNHLFSEKFFSDVSLISTKYKYKLTARIGDDESIWDSNIIDYGGRTDFTWLVTPSATLKFGLGSTYHTFEPGEATSSAQETSISMTTSNALDHMAYVSFQHQLWDRLTFKYGLRFSMFQNIGPGTSYRFTPEHKKIDSVYYSSGKIFNTYKGFEPRFGAVYQLNESSSLKASYSRTMQYLHLLSNSSAGSPLDIWVPSSPNVEPQIADQGSVGYFRNFSDDMFETSLELYYKETKHVIDFKDHADIVLRPDFESELRFGDGKSYGVEAMIRKNKGKLTGWLSYTLTRSNRTIPEINEGRTYRAPSDRPHNISIVASYEFSKRVTASASWVYLSGVPVTYPVGKFEFNGAWLPLYDGRNTFRMPDYHRMDLSVTLKGKEKPGRRWKGEWNFSLYNAYGRKNPWYISFVQDQDNPERTYAEMIYLFTFVPSITYNFTF